MGLVGPVFGRFPLLAAPRHRGVGGQRRAPRLSHRARARCPGPPPFPRRLSLCASPQHHLLPCAHHVTTELREWRQQASPSARGAEQGSPLPFPLRPGPPTSACRTASPPRPVGRSKPAMVRQSAKSEERASERKAKKTGKQADWLTDKETGRRRETPRRCSE